MISRRTENQWKRVLEIVTVPKKSKKHNIERYIVMRKCKKQKRRDMLRKSVFKKK